VIPSGVDDGGLISGPVEPGLWVMALAHLKARSAWQRLDDDHTGAIVLGADTIVVKDDDLIGQPADEEDARRIIETLDGGTHRVLTGVAIIDEYGNRALMWDESVVSVGRVEKDVREAYIATGGWRGKAGAYNLSERIADGWPITFEEIGRAHV